MSKVNHFNNVRDLIQRNTPVRISKKTPSSSLRNALTSSIMTEVETSQLKN